MRRRTFTHAALASALWTAASTRAVSSQAQNLGGLLISGFRGTSSSDPEVTQILRYLEASQIAGVILLKRNIRSPEQVAHLTGSFREAAGALTPIISVDQEGGKIARLGPENGFLAWMSPADAAREMTRDEEIMSYYAPRAAELAAVGINLNFAPSVDLNLNPSNPIIGALGRSFGASATDVVRVAAAFVIAHRQSGVATCLKHFPGHGSSMTDSHDGPASIAQTWSPEELEPFSQLVQWGLADMIMTAHLLLPSMTASQSLPASLSDRVAGVIRDQIGFSGPIVTDDMQMGAITAGMDAGGAAIDAVNAGNTLQIYSNYRKRDSVETVRTIAQALEAAAQQDALDLGLAEQQLELVRHFRGGLLRR